MNSGIEFLENNIIAAFITDKSSHYKIKELSEEFFMTEKSKKIFKIIKNLFLNHEEINIITITNKLTSGKNSTKILEELIKITDEVIINVNIDTYIEKLKDIHLRNKIQKIIVNTAKKINNVEFDVQDIKKELIKNLISIKDERQLDNAESIQDSFTKTLDSIESKHNKSEDFSYFTGFFELDKLTDGLHENELTAIGARPGVGKTAFAINIATNIAKKKRKVYFCSLEMSSEQLMQRIIANYCSINTQFLRTGRIQDNEVIKIADQTNDILNLNLKIDTKTREIEELENIVINLKDKNEIDLLIIDYLTLLKSREKYMSRELEVADISRKLKLLALDLHIPIVILVQLNRDAENKVPCMSNIRESGSIEQNCDNIIFLHKEDNEKKLVENIKVILEKQRQGGTGVVEVKFDKKYSRFSNKF